MSHPLYPGSPCRIPFTPGAHRRLRLYSASIAAYNASGDYHSPVAQLMALLEGASATSLDLPRQLHLEAHFFPS